MNRQRKLFSFHPEMALFRNPPVEDTEGGETDKSLRVPCEMFIPLNAQPIQLGRSLFNRGQSAESLVPA